MSENINTQTSLIKPTYFEIFNRVLNELNRREIKSFEEIEKEEDKRILNHINATNAEVLSSYVWNFQIEKTSVELQKDCATIMNNFEGKIICVCEGNKKYKYVHPALINSLSQKRADVYSNIGPLLLTNPIKQIRKLDIYYVSSQYALNSSNQRIPKMSAKDDTSTIPMPHVEPILVYGTLIRVKANPNFAKFSFWRAMYYNSINILRSAGNLSCEDYPHIKLGIN